MLLLLTLYWDIAGTPSGIFSNCPASFPVSRRRGIRIRAAGPREPGGSPQEPEDAPETVDSVNIPKEKESSSDEKNI